jgi:hypothetical protein
VDVLAVEIEAQPWQMGSVGDEPVPYGGGASIGIRVNDEPLRDLVRRYELSSATASGQPDLAGSYGLLSGYRFDTGLFLGEPANALYRTSGGVALMVCTCGDVGCWPFVVRIDISDDEIVWHDFRQPHRPAWSYAEFAPLHFDRTAYDAEVADAERRFRELVVDDPEQRENYERRRAVVPHWPSWETITGSADPG